MKPYPRRDPGAVLVFAVLLLAAGVFVLTGIAQLAATQAVVSQDEWDALQRRNTLDNSRAMAKQFIQNRMFRGVVSTKVGYTNADLGGFSVEPEDPTIRDYWTTPSRADSTRDLQINPFTPMERGGFYRAVVLGKLRDDLSPTRTNEIDWNFQVRTRSPIAAGYSFVRQLPSANNLAGVVPAGIPYIDVRARGKLVGFQDVPRIPFSSVTNINPDPSGFAGYLDVPLIPGGSSYSIRTNCRIEPRGNNLQLVLDLLDDGVDDTNSVVLFQMTNDFVSYTNTPNNTGRIVAVVLQGANTPTNKPLHIVIGPSITNTFLLVLSNNNERLVYLNREKQVNDGAPLDIIADQNASSWRLGLTVASSSVQFEIGSLEIIGGLRTDGELILQAGTTFFLPEGTPQGLDYIADRVMWLEDYRRR